MMKADVADRKLTIDLDGRHAFGLAQGMLAELAGCSPARAGAVLLQVGAQLGFDSADSIAEFFLASATAEPGLFTDGLNLDTALILTTCSSVAGRRSPG